MARLLSPDPAGIAQAVDHLRSGGLVVFPTETVYGLGAAARDADAVARVFAAKGRPTDHPLIVHLPTAAHLWQWADRDAISGAGSGTAAVERLAEGFWPGPLTLVLPALPSVPRAVTGGQDTVALRVPAGDVPCRLLAAFGEALVAPSANRFGRVSPTRAEHVLSEFPDEDVLVIDGGQTAHGLESTILDLSSGPPRVLRPGALPLARLAEYVTTLKGGPVTGAPRAPGMLERHYAPSTPLRITRGEDLDRRSGERTGVISTRPPYEDVKFAAVPGGQLSRDARWLVLPPDAPGFGRELFAAVRHLDALGLEEVLVEEPPSGEEWLAVRDRLQRAAAPGGRPLVAVVMGSTSDWETMRTADEVLAELGVPHVCKVVSAHRTPERLSEFARGAAAAGYQVIVAGAGGAAHLPGMIAAHTHLPVFGVPVRSSALSGIDSLLSVVQMPSGVPVGTLAIGQAGATNAALLAVAVLALQDEGLRERLVSYRRAQTERATASELPTDSFEP